MAAGCPSCSRPEPPSSSSSSTPFVSAPSSPPFSTLASYSSRALPRPSDFCSSDFDFSARFSEVEYWPPGPMSSAEELFHNGRIRPLLSHRLPDAWTQPSFNSCPRRLHGVDDISSYSHACAGRCDAAPRDYDHGSVYDLCDCCEGSMDSVESNFSAPFSSPQSSPSHEAMSPRAGEPRASALEQWKKSKVLQAQGSMRRSNHPRRSDEMVDARRVARAAESSSEPRLQRRARSLSPLRVFSDTKHGQVQQRRQSVDGGTKAAPHAATSKDSKRRSGRKSWTLKELLYIGDTRVHESSTSNAHEAAERGKAGERRARSIRPQSSSSSRKPAVAASHEASGMHYCVNGGGGIGQTRTSSSYLPAHKHVGLVGCIGFFSKSCSSLKGAGLAHVHHPRHAYVDKP